MLTHLVKWSSRALWIALLSLPLLSACTPGQAPSQKSASGGSPAAFVYTYVSQSGESGVAGARASDGAEVWRAPIGHANWRPIIVGSTVYTCVAKWHQASQDIVAVRVTDGRILWSVSLPNSGFSDIINANATTVAVVSGEGLYALDARTGATRWHATLSSRLPAVVTDDVVAVVAATPLSSSLALTAFRASDGKQLWRANDEVSNDRFEITTATIFIGSSVAPSYAFSLPNGHQVWKGPLDGAPIATAQGVVILDSHDNLAAVSPENGASVWRSSIDAGFNQFTYGVAPVVNGALYLVNQHGLVAVRTIDGAILWRVDEPLDEAESVIIRQGVAYLYRSTNPPGSLWTGDPEIIALDAVTGKSLWKMTVHGAQMLAEPVAGE